MLRVQPEKDKELKKKNKSRVILGSPSPSLQGRNPFGSGEENTCHLFPKRGALAG